MIKYGLAKFSTNMPKLAEVLCVHRRSGELYPFLGDYWLQKGKDIFCGNIKPFVLDKDDIRSYYHENQDKKHKEVSLDYFYRSI